MNKFLMNMFNGCRMKEVDDLEKAELAVAIGMAISLKFLFKRSCLFTLKQFVFFLFSLNQTFV